MKLIKEEVNQKNKYEKLFDEMLEYMEFRLVKYPDGTFGLVDLQGGNLGNIEDDRFDNAVQLLDRLDIYYDDYFINPIADELKDKGIESFHKDFSILKFRDELPDSGWDFDVLDMVINHSKDIDLNNCYREDDLIGESLKEDMKQDIILTKAQKEYVLDDLFEDDDLHTQYKEFLDKEWKISYDKSLDPDAKGDDDAKQFPAALIVDGEFADALSQDFVNKIVALKESKQLNEGTSNFWTQDELPLYAFITYDEAEDEATHAAKNELSAEDYEDTDKRLDYIDDYFDKYFNDYAILYDTDIEELEDDIDVFNSFVKELSYDAYDKYEELRDKGDDKQADTYYDASDYLEYLKLKIKDGYYEGAQLYLDGWDKYFIEVVPEEYKKEILDEYNKLAKKYNLMNLVVAYHASNGETGYNLIKESKTLTERVWRYTLRNGAKLRNAIDLEDGEGIRDALLACYKELLDKDFIDEYDYDDWTEEIRDADWEDEYGNLDDDAIDFELDQLYDLCDNIDVFVALDDDDEDIDWNFEDDMNESLEGKDRKKFITLLTNELQKEPLAYSKDEANDIAIKRADALGKNPYDSIEALVKSEVSKTCSKKDWSLKEDTVKQGNAWVNKGKEGTHGKFKTKKAADAQRKAMFANSGKNRNFGESLKEDKKSSGDAYLIATQDGVGVVHGKIKKYDDGIEIGVATDEYGRKTATDIRSGLSIIGTHNPLVDIDTKEETFGDKDTNKLFDQAHDLIARVPKDFYLSKPDIYEKAGVSREDVRSGKLSDMVKNLSLKEAKGLDYWTVDWDTDKKPRKEVLDWWAEVEQWNADHDYPYDIDNGDRSDVEGMFVAIFDMANELKDVEPELAKKGARINNKYGFSQMKVESLEEAKENELYDGKYYEYKDHSFILLYLDVTKDELANGAKEEYAICCEDIVEDYDNAPAFVGTVDLDATDDDVLKAIADNYDALLNSVGKGRHIESIEEGVGATIASMVVGKGIETLGNMADQLVNDNSFKGESLKEAVGDDNYVIYTELDDIKGTSEENYNRDIRDAGLIHNFTQAGFDSVEQVKDYVDKYFKVKGDIIVKDNVEESIENKEDNKVDVYILMDDKYNWLEERMDVEEWAKDIHSDEEAIKYFKENKPEAKWCAKMVYTYDDNGDFVERKDDFDFFRIREDEPFINDTENVPFEVNEYDDAMTVLEQLKQLEDMDGYDKEMLERILSTNSFSFEEALNILEDGDYSFYPGAFDTEQLGYAIIDSIGSIEDAVSKDQLYYYVDEDRLRRDLSFDVREFYRDTAEEEVEYEHRFDEESEYDLEEEVEKWLDEHEDDLLDQMVEETIDGELLDDDQLETYFDFEKFGRDCTYEGNCFFVDDGCLMLY